MAKTTIKKTATKKAFAGKPVRKVKEHIAVTTFLAQNFPLTAEALKPKAVTVKIEFTSGIGQLTVSLFRNGILVNMESVNKTSDIQFSSVLTGDAISCNGVCTGEAEININTSTDPGTPQIFKVQSIHIGFDVL